MQIALEKLGFGKCYHMEELIMNPQGVGYWEDAMEGKGVNWEALFEGYQAIVDFPGSMYYKELSDYYPEAKVILGLRDPESWYTSAYQTIFRVDPGLSLKLRIGLQALYKRRAKDIIRIIRLIDQSLWKNYFEGKFEDKAYAIERYNRHIVSVKEEIDPDCLLLHDPKEGWEPLCQFLNKEVPDEPYPRSNQGADFRSYTRGVIAESLRQE